MQIRIILIAVLAALVVAAGSEGAEAAHGFPRHRCGSFVAEDSSSEGTTYYNRITVYSSRHLPCRTATAVVEGFWGPEEFIVRHGGPSEAQSYYTIKGFPGWRCYQGAGAGSCIRRGRVAGYAAKNV